ncbi:MAG: hypothetical protein LPL29_15015 [Alphaproteobacteria bacterium]|nr:hypothetical protein [Alphaproteobacteria bacterium]
MIRKFLDISTGHLTVHTREMIDAGKYDDTLSYTPWHDYGWFVWVPTDQFTYAGCSTDLRNCFDRAKALGCDYILFDRDAQRDEELHYYD